MSLSEVILEIAQEMEEAAQSCSDSPGAVLTSSVISWAKQLRRLVKASGATSSGVIQATAPPESALDALKLSTSSNHRLALFEKAAKQLALQEEALEGTMALLIGGGLNGDTLSLPPGAEVGYEYKAGGEVYVLKEDGRLHFSASKTCGEKGLVTG